MFVCMIYFESSAHFQSLIRHLKWKKYQKRDIFLIFTMKQPMRQLVESLNSGLRPFAPEYITDPEKAIYRIYRDVRFSKDKKPYKEHIAASFHLRGTTAHGEAGYYVALSHKEVGIGGGVYLPQPPQLAAIRRNIAEKHREFRRILAARPVRRLLGELQGEQLSRVPKGFACDHPAADLLRYKRFILYVELEPAIARSPGLYKEIVDRFRAMVPFMRFLTASMPAQARRIGARDLFG